MKFEENAHVSAKTGSTRQQQNIQRNRSIFNVKRCPKNCVERLSIVFALLAVVVSVYTMEYIKLFLREVTEELLYNIVFDEGEITYLALSDEFENKTGFRPMEFFGFGNITDGGWFNFIRGIPGVQGENLISIEGYSDDSDDESNSDSSEDEVVYKSFNTTYLIEGLTSFPMATVAKYREVILIKCCEILEDQFVDEIGGKDANDNTPLHLVAALPGISHDCETLVKYLLEAGVDPLATNDNGQTFLHIILGRFEAKNDDDDALDFDDERLVKTEWFVDDRIELLTLLSEQLSPTFTSVLAKAQDNDGNTVLHEYARSAAEGEEFVKERVVKKLLGLGASFRVTNNMGDVPLHYAANSKLFKIFVKNGAVCRARNDRDESPVLYLVKRSVYQAFAGTTAAKELKERCYVKTNSSRSVQEAIKLQKSVKDIISENKDAKETVWTPDKKGNIAIDIILIAIRIGSYGLDRSSKCSTDLLKSLVSLLKEMLRNATPHDMQRTNKQGQNFFHVLLDTDNNEHEISNDSYILKSIEILLNHGVNVNAVDSDTCTPLDIVNKHRKQRPSFYKNCTELLTDNGATKGHRERVTTSSFVQPSSLLKKMSNLLIRDETRKVRSCPKRHSNKAKRLTESNTNVTVVEKYRYSDQDLIGTGAFSSVFIAIKDENVDSKSGAIECRAYALKRIEKAKLNDKEIKREITTLLSLSDKCENIIKCYEAVEDNNFQYICLDLMDADLQEFVTNNDVNKVLKSNPAKQVEMTEGIINGLAFLHEQKFIHRDLKPGNILYTTDPDLHFKITDFGLTKNTSSLSMSSTAASGVAMAPGTRCWMAPELVSLKQKEHTQQSDVFSLGLVVHYLLTLGKHPFVNEDEEPAHVIERKITEKPPNFDRKLSPEAKSFLQILLNKVSSKRPPASCLNQHPYLWSDRKKIEFLKAVGDQPEAEKPAEYPYSDLEKRLQTTDTGQRVRFITWDSSITELYKEMVSAWKRKKYRTDKVIDLIRFIRNAYTHKQDRSSNTKLYLDENIFFRAYPSLVLDVFGVVQQLGFDEKRSSIRDALNS